MPASIAIALAMESRRMTDLTPNLPEVVAEIAALFERYEQALIDKNVDVLDATFWDSPHTIRYALHENGYGFSEIHAHRVARPPGPGHQGKAAAAGDPDAGPRHRHREPRVQGARPRPGRPADARCSCAFPDLGWKVVSAHVSTMEGKPLW